MPRRSDKLWSEISDESSFYGTWVLRIPTRDIKDEETHGERKKNEGDLYNLNAELMRAAGNEEEISELEKLVRDSAVVSSCMGYYLSYHLLSIFDRFPIDYQRLT